ncbi:MAG: hypothetical protein K2R98_27520 [Gemmataceae bacterium]|nr:hypothetical protein [Gemmataceae bacterium]
MRYWAALAAVSIAWSTAVAGKPVVALPSPAYSAGLTIDQLVHMSREELEALYCQAQPGPVPEGYLCGKAIRWAGTKWAAPNAKVTGCLWKGKQFDACDAAILNKWCGGVLAVKARVYCAESWLDGKPAIVMDYRGVSKVIWKDVRDELRQVAPGIYLGVMFQEKCTGPKFKMFFALETTAPCE